MITCLGKEYFKGQEQKVYLVCGKACKDGSFRKFDSGKEKGSVPVKGIENEDGTATWVDITGWGADAKGPAAANKGDYILAIGRLGSREYNGKTYHDLTADYFAISGGAKGRVPHPADSPAPAGTAVDVHADEFADDADLELGELPF